MFFFRIHISREKSYHLLPRKVDLIVTSSILPLHSDGDHWRQRNHLHSQGPWKETALHDGHRPNDSGAPGVRLLS